MSTTTTIELGQIAIDLKLKESQVNATVELLDSGNTVSFITRYRKDQTGGLDEEQIRGIQDRVNKARMLADRRQTILRSIQSQGKLTEELEKLINEARSTKRLDDLYLPFKPKKQSLASTARDRGLEPLANEILHAEVTSENLNTRAADFINEDKKVPSVADALLGAGHILAEMYSERADLRQAVRKIFYNSGTLVSNLIAEKPSSDDKAAKDKPTDTSKPEETATIEVTGTSGGAESPAVTESNSNAAESSEAQSTADATPTNTATTDPEGTTANEPPAVETTIVETNTEEAAAEQGSDEKTSEAAESTDEASTEKDSSTVENTTTEESPKDETQSQPETSAGEVTTDVTTDQSENKPASEETKVEAKKAEPKKTAKQLKQESLALAKAAKKKKKEKLKEKKIQSFSDYFDYKESIKKIPHHRVLAINRGERGKILRVKLDVDDDAIVQTATELLVKPDHPHTDFLTGCVRDSLSRLVVPSLQREFRRDLTDKAEQHAVTVFARNLRNLLLQSPVHEKRLLAVDPGFRSGCKLVALDEFGNLLGHDIVYVIGNASRRRAARKKMAEMITLHKLNVIVIGNGTACRETEQAVADMIEHYSKEPKVEPPEAAQDDSTTAVSEPSSTEATSPEQPDSAVETSAIENSAQEKIPETSSTETTTAETPVESESSDPTAATNETVTEPGGEATSESTSSESAEISTTTAEIKDPSSEPPTENSSETSAEQTDTTPDTSASAVATATATPVADSSAKKTPPKPQPPAIDPLEIHEAVKQAAYVIVNEAGASVYSTSAIGREEFPDYDATLRGAISIGRRLQDPLSELVKIDPSNIGVGLYQHDVKAKHLKESLDAVVESCVNYVGVDVNTASPALLRYVSGLNQLTARRLYEYRTENGPFSSREALKTVPGFGEVAYVQAAGFLKISGGENPLDSTWIHPESYEIAEKILQSISHNPSDIGNKDKAESLGSAVATLALPEQAQNLGVGERLVEDIAQQISRPGRDPRENLPAPIFKKGILKLEDLTPSMELSGTVLNVVDFGAFIDFGLHDSGLVHVSQLSNKYTSDPHEVVSVGDIVQVWVMSIDKERRRVSLTMLPPGVEREKPQRRSGKPAAKTSGKPQDKPTRSEKPGKRQRRGGGRRDQRGGKKTTHRTEYRAKPKPKVPITDAMKKGKEPMRTFGDLSQFFQTKDEDPKDKKDKK